MIHNKNSASSELRLSLHMEYKEYNNKNWRYYSRWFQILRWRIESKSDSDLKIDTKSVK